MSFAAAVADMYDVQLAFFGVGVTVSATGRELTGIFRYPYEESERYGVETVSGDAALFLRESDVQDIAAGSVLEVSGQADALTVVDVRAEREGGLYRLSVREYA